MPLFQLEAIAVGGDCAVLRITGEVDIYTAPQVRERVIQLLADGVLHIIMDLRDAQFMDSTGLGVLVGSLKRLRLAGGSLRLVIGPGRIYNLFRITGLVNVFTLHESMAEAIAADHPWQRAVAWESHDRAEWCREHELLLPLSGVCARIRPATEKIMADSGSVVDPVHGSPPNPPPSPEQPRKSKDHRTGVRIMTWMGSARLAGTQGSGTARSVARHGETGCAGMGKRVAQAWGNGLRRHGQRVAQAWGTLHTAGCCHRGRGSSICRLTASAMAW